MADPRPSSKGPPSTFDRSDARSSRATVPPSEPRPTSRASFSALDAQVERPARVQMIVALMLGLVLVAIPLYLWRRPRAPSIAASAASASAEATPPPPPEPEPPPVALAAPRVLGCHDPGPRRTPPERCDHLEAVEEALAAAIEQSASCVPKDAGGTIPFVADVSFKRKSVRVTTSREGRTVTSAKVVAACQAAVRAKVRGTSLDGVPHEHARYKILVAATYPGGARP